MNDEPAPMATTGTGRQQASGLALVFGGMVSVQFGAAVAATLFPLIGPSATVAVRFGFATALLALFNGFRVRGRTAAELRLVALLGFSLALMVVLLYQAIDRMPLGAVITIEYCGPLAVAVVLSRRWHDVAVALLAAVGVAVLAGGLGGAELVGVLFALGAAAGWALYIVASTALARRRATGVLPLAAAVATLLVAPWALPSAGPEGFSPPILLVGLVVAFTSSVLPHSADLRALRVVPARLFGVVMSLHPAVAAVAGWLVLDQVLSSRELLGMALVVLASAVAAWLATRPVDEVITRAAEGG